MDQMEEVKRPDPFNANSSPSVKTSCGNMYVHYMWLKDNKGVKRIFADLGKAGNCPMSFLDAMSFLVKECIKAGVPPKKLIKGLRGIGCNQPCETATSCADAFGRTLEMVFGDDK